MVCQDKWSTVFLSLATSRFDSQLMSSQTQYAAAERRQADENARLSSTVQRVSRQLDDLRQKYRRFEALETGKFEQVRMVCGGRGL